MESERDKVEGGSAVMRDFSQLMKDMERVDFNLSFEAVPDKVILLLGETKAGKTTLMYYLLGKRLIREYNQEMGLYHMKPEAKIFDALIGNTYESATVYPNIPTEVGDDRVLIIDMPGFSDTRNLYRLLNIYIIREVIKKIRSVHVSLVIPNETFEANFLASIIERNCMLLSHALVVTPKCISFILTKIEDREDELATFRGFLEELREERGDDAVGEAIHTLSNANIYVFENTEPVIEAGVALKAQIVAENRFFQTDEKPDNLLSGSYADIISGEKDHREFSAFVIDVLQAVADTLLALLPLFTAALQLHHLPELTLIAANVPAEHTLTATVLALAQQLHAGAVSSLTISLSEECKPAAGDVRLLSLVKKFYRQRNQVDEVGLLKGELENLSEASRSLAGEESRVSKELRKKMHDLFKFCAKVCRTISHIQQPEIIPHFEAFSNHAGIATAIQDYRRVDDDLIVKAAQSELGHQLREREEFRQILLEVRPDLEAGGEEEVVSRKVATRGRIRNKKVLETLQTTKQVDSPPHRPAAHPGIPIPDMSKESIRAIRNMPLEHVHLRTLLEAIQTFHSKFEKPKDEVGMQFGMALLRKTAQLLERLELFEEAILFYLAMSAETEAERAIGTALDFGELTHNFIRQMLLPYYYSWNPHFEMLVTLYNYLSLTTYDPSKLIDTELEMATRLEEMRGLDFEKLQPLRRFQLALIYPIFKEDTYRGHILETASRHEHRLARSKVPALERELSSMRLYD